MSKYPEHERLSEVSEQSQAIGEFLDWLTHQRGIVLAEWIEVDGVFVDEKLAPIYDRIEELLAEYYGIDLDLIEREKQKMLEEHRKLTDKYTEEGWDYS